jgi:hypothetical protein
MHKFHLSKLRRINKNDPEMSEEINSKRIMARTARTVEMMKKGDFVKSDIGEYSGLRVE